LLDALRQYDGTVVCASHDAAIVDRIATRVLEIRDTSCKVIRISADS
jgi:ATPase subunit of ABC transporter with duplicated ATPase domains